MNAALTPAVPTSRSVSTGSGPLVTASMSVSGRTRRQVDESGKYSIRTGIRSRSVSGPAGVLRLAVRGGPPAWQGVRLGYLRGGRTEPAARLAVAGLHRRGAA